MQELKNAPQHEQYPYDIFQAGDQVHINGWTDVNPGTVIEVRRNGKEVHVQQDEYKLADGEKPEFIAGGFAGHCTNQHSLKYDITRNEQGGVQVFTLRKWRGRYVWTPKGGSPNGTQYIAKGWHAYYDYNF